MSRGTAPSRGGWRARPATTTLIVGVALPLTSVALGILLVLPPSALDAQEPAPEPRVVDVRFEARIGAAGADGLSASRVRLVYRLLPAPGSETVPLKVLAFFGNRPEELEASLDGRTPAPVALESPRDGLLRAGVPLPAGAAGGETITLTLSYRVDRAIPEEARDFDLVLPILYVDWRPLGAPEDMFVASVTIPSDYSVVETFPTVPKQVTAAGGERTYDFRVQVVPSMVRFRGHVGEPPLLTFARKVDLGVVFVLLVAGGFGWWGLTRETA